MKFLLVAINAKYIHSNLGVYSLKAYWKYAGSSGYKESRVEIGEYTINHRMEDVLKDIYIRKPDVIGFSCYIWNIRYVMDLVHDIHKILPEVPVWLGGPEVSFCAKELLDQEVDVTGIMMGEGEETFSQLMEYYSGASVELNQIDGVAVRTATGQIIVNSIRPVMDMSKIPFPYQDLSDFEHRIIYYESSRGCPFSCSYCLSSIDKSVRFRDTKLVKQELKFFLDHKVSQVKFVDRTFNCKKSHAMEIWNYIVDQDNGVTNFHFEISADLLGEEELELMSRMRPGLIQLEIGVQTTNSRTIREIRRKMDLGKLSQVVSKINSHHNIHQHLDLIAGLPYEDCESFKQSFNAVYQMKPEQLQLGFLKVLKGSFMEQQVHEYELQYQSQPPYEVLSTRWLSYESILIMKAVEEMVEVYYNSGQFRKTMEALVPLFSDPFTAFASIASYYEKNRLLDRKLNRLTRYEILFQFIQSELAEKSELIEQFRDCLMFDLYLRENVKSRPYFARNQDPYKTKIRDFFIREAECPEYMMGYENYDSKQMSKMAHIEVFGDGTFVLFDYLNRDPLNYNAKAQQVPKALSKEPKAFSKEPKALSKEPKALSKEPKALSKVP